MAIVMLVMGVLAAAYLGGVVNASSNIRDFPIAVVNQDTGADIGGKPLRAGDALAEAIVSGADSDEFDVSLLSADEAKERMSEGKLYGAIVIPANFSSSLSALARSVTVEDEAPQPTVSVLTNPRSGTGTSATVSNFGTAALAAAESVLGSDLVAQATVAGQRGSTLLSGAAVSALRSPIAVKVSAFEPLPDGTGGGASAFYYALLLILAGLTGSLILSAQIDASLGFVPSEFGPIYMMRDHSGLGRLTTLAIKWLSMLGLATLVSALYMLIGSTLGMPIDHGWLLWAYGAFAIFAVASVVQTVTAILGGLGMIVNLLIFIILSLPSAGGTVPLEATPGIFRWLGSFEPMRQIYLGTRSILYLDGSLDAGLGRALIFCAIATTLGLIVGFTTMRFYDRRGHHRILAD